MQRYWDVTITGNPIVPSRVSILETLPKVVANPPKISPVNKNSFFGHIVFKIRSGIAAHPFITAGLGVAIVTGVSIWGRGALKRHGGRSFGSGGFFNLNEKDGLLGAPGGTAGGKVD